MARLHSCNWMSSRGGIVERRRTDGRVWRDLLDAQEVLDGSIPVARLPLRGPLPVHGGSDALGQIGAHLRVGGGELARLDQRRLRRGKLAFAVIRLTDDGPGDTPFRLVGWRIARQKYSGDLHGLRQVTRCKHRLVGARQHTGAVGMFRERLRELDARVDRPPPQICERRAAQSRLGLLIRRQGSVTGSSPLADCADGHKRCARTPWPPAHTAGRRTARRRGDDSTPSHRTRRGRNRGTPDTSGPLPRIRARHVSAEPAHDRRSPRP